MATGSGPYWNRTPAAINASAVKMSHRLRFIAAGWSEDRAKGSKLHFRFNHLISIPV